MGNNDINLTNEKQALSEFFSSLLSEGELLQQEPKKQDLEYQKQPDITNIITTEETLYLPNIPSTVIEITEKTNQQNVSEKESSSIVNDARVKGEAFQIMMFKTAGLTLAVPLVELSGVITWPENITVMPGHKDSYLGITKHLEKNIPIIDIAQIVFPQDRVATLVTSNKNERLQRIVFINDFEWGLACDAVDDVIIIEPDQIKWRKSSTKRAWLAGTVVEHMCALLDTKELSKLLNSDHS